jgi:hypothetical protein
VVNVINRHVEGERAPPVLGRMVAPCSRVGVVEQPRDDKAMRASDADREQVAEVLRAAAGDGRLTLAELQDRLEALYAARTYGELEPVVSDLPVSALPSAKGLAPSQASPTPVSARPASPDRVGGKPTTWVAKAVFGGIARRGQWVVPSQMRVKAVFGGADLDLREARLETDDVVMDVKAVFGGVNIILPDDVIAVVEGTGMFGGFDDQAATRQPPPGSPVVRITGKAVFGGVSVQRKPPGPPR